MGTGMRRSECGRAGRLASLARAHLWRDVTGFLAYRAFMAIPTFLPLRWFMWMAPAVGDWSERDARWTFAFERAAQDDGERPRMSA